MTCYRTLRTSSRGALVLMCALASVLPAQSVPDSSFDAHTTAELRQIVDSARLRRLPTAPLVNRALQGAARKVPGPRVVALVRAHADSMWAAREALGADAGPDEIDAGGSALRAGASRASLRSLRSARPSGTAITALVVLTDLLSRGVAPVDAASAVTSLASRSTDAALLMFQGAVTRDGTPESRERLQAMVERVVRQIPRQPDAPARMPDEVPAPSLRGAGSAGAQSANESAPSAGHARATMTGAVELASVSDGSDGSPHGALGRGVFSFPLGGAWSMATGAALSVGPGDAGDRWSTGVTLTRAFRTAAPLAANIWMSGELRVPIARTRGAIPLNSSLDLRGLSTRRASDAAYAVGGELLQRLRGTARVGTSLEIGQHRFSRRELARSPARGASPPTRSSRGPTPRGATGRPARCGARSTVRRCAV